METGTHPHLLIIEDDVLLNDMTKRLLTQHGYCVTSAYSGSEALLLIEKGTFDLILLDLMLPGLSGEEVLPYIKEIPVIVISAKVDTLDKVNLLLGGAVDYVSKPFNIKELLARITVQFRKLGNTDNSKQLSFGDLELYPSAHQVQVCGKDIHLTRTEYAILKLLMQNPRQVITKSIMLDRLSEDTPDCMESSLKVHISNLRKKLRQAGGKDYIEAVWGIGFKLIEQ